MEKVRFAGIVILAGVVAVGVSQGVEIFINRVLRPDATELTWIGDLVAAGGFMVMTTLVLKLREAQEVLSAMERERLVLDTQLSIAADVQRGLLPPRAEAEPRRVVVRRRRAGREDRRRLLRLPAARRFLDVRGPCGCLRPSCVRACCVPHAKATDQVASRDGPTIARSWSSASGLDRSITPYVQSSEEWRDADARPRD